MQQPIYHRLAPSTWNAHRSRGSEQLGAEVGLQTRRQRPQVTAIPQPPPWGLQSQGPWPSPTKGTKLEEKAYGAGQGRVTNTAANCVLQSQTASETRFQSWKTLGASSSHHLCRKGKPGSARGPQGLAPGQGLIRPRRAHSTRSPREPRPHTAGTWRAHLQQAHRASALTPSQGYRTTKAP